jgi:hypothetical protein
LAQVDQALSDRTALDRYRYERITRRNCGGCYLSPVTDPATTAVLPARSSALNNQKPILFVQAENQCVGGPIPPLGTIEITRQFPVLKRRDGAVFKVGPAPDGDFSCLVPAPT